MTKSKHMSKDQFAAALEALELNQASAAAFLDKGLRTLNGYANGRPVPRCVQLLLELMIARGIKPADLTWED
jgi:hypothetical protein